MADGKTIRPITQNRRARHEYVILEEEECGIVLKGTEVKVLRSGKGSIAEAYGKVEGGELWLLGMHIPEYPQGNVFNHPPTRPRKLLMHGRQLKSWHAQARERGITIVPLEVYFSGSLVKVRMGLCRGKKLHDKRQATREREDRRDIDRAMNRRR